MVHSSNNNNCSFEIRWGAAESHGEVRLDEGRQQPLGGRMIITIVTTINCIILFITIYYYLLYYVLYVYYYYTII